MLQSFDNDLGDLWPRDHMQQLDTCFHFYFIPVSLVSDLAGRLHSTLSSGSLLRLPDGHRATQRECSQTVLDKFHSVKERPAALPLA